jgi:uncharacterized SAM-binding protein YcdF (DUF218 family)
MFLFKKIFSRLFFPIPLCLEILLLGMFFLIFTKKQRIGKVIVLVGILFLGLISTDFVPDRLLLSLERQYPKFEKSMAQGKDVKWIVVLGAGVLQDSSLPISSRLNDAAMFRTIEALRIHEMFPRTTLLLSGGGEKDELSSARGMARLVLSLGWGVTDIILEERPRDTAEEARFIQEKVGKDDFVLVTSASHMPRALGLFRKQGMNPIPAPTHHLVEENDTKKPWEYFPSDHAVHKMKRAVYEYLGLTWAKLRGQIERFD